MFLNKHKKFSQEENGRKNDVEKPILWTKEKYERKTTHNKKKENSQSTKNAFRKI